MFKHHTDRNMLLNNFQKWTNGICVCLGHPCLSVKSVFCPCIIHADNYYRIYGKNYISQMIFFMLCYPIAGGHIRRKIQNRLYIKSNRFNTYLLSCLLPCCTVAQGKLELDYYNIQTPPPPYQTMI